MVSTASGRRQPAQTKKVHEKEGEGGDWGGWEGTSRGQHEGGRGNRSGRQVRTCFDENLVRRRDV